MDNFAYTFTPDPQVPLTARGHRQAEAAGHKIKAALEVRLCSRVPEGALFRVPPSALSLTNRQPGTQEGSCARGAPLCLWGEHSCVSVVWLPL